MKYFISNRHCTVSLVGAGFHCNTWFKLADPYCSRYCCHSYNYLVAAKGIQAFLIAGNLYYPYHLKRYLLEMG